jgi:hypothetical protein
MIVTLWIGSAQGRVQPDEGVPGLVIGDHPLLALGEHGAATLRARHHLVDGLFQIDGAHRRAPAPGGEQGPLVEEIGQVGSGEPRGTAGNDLQVDLG